MQPGVTNLKILALIPARGGSKGVPRKNIRMLADKPLIAWTIEAVKNCNFTMRTVVSTDDPDVAEIAKAFGAEVPFLRPTELATDTTADYPVCVHALDWLFKNEYYKPDLVVWLRPTTPMRQSHDIDKSIKQIVATDCTGLRSVCAVEHHPYWMKSLSINSNQLIPFIEGASEEKYYQRQLLPTIYRLNGAVDITWYQTIQFEKKLYGSNIQGYVMPIERSIDIDTEIDFLTADLFMRQRLE